MTEINKLIEKTERLLAAATPGLYIVELDTYTDTWTVSIPGLSIAEELNEPDARLFAAAPATLRALVDEVYRLRRQVAQLEFDRTTQPNADWQPNRL